MSVVKSVNRVCSDIYNTTFKKKQGGGKTLHETASASRPVKSRARAAVERLAPRLADLGPCLPGSVHFLQECVGTKASSLLTFPFTFHFPLLVFGAGEPGRLG